MDNGNLVTIFATGLLAGGLTCLAVQGGLLTVTIAQREELKLKEKAQRNGGVLPVTLFLVAKLAAYTLLGFLLGWFGSVFQLSLIGQIVMQTVVVVFMVGTALNMLNIHPVFRYFIIQPPRFVTKKIRNQSKSRAIFTPALLGAFTVLIPCGITQAMMALAIGSGSPLVGGAILFSFVLGTSPLFFAFGYFATKLNEVLEQRLMKFTAYAILLLALYNLNNLAALSGMSLSFGSKAVGVVPQQAQIDGLPQPIGSQEVTLYIDENGYTPKNLVLRPKTKVKLHLVNTTGNGCQQAITIPSLRIQKVIPVGKTDTVEFTTPAVSGQIAFMCSMGMYRGIISVS